jgi:ATP-dependent Lhr-like helicase
MLSGKYPSDVAAELDARMSWDRVTDSLTSARASRMVAVISGGTIPDRGLYTINLPDRTRLGELDEEFVHETRLGDVFQLGSSTWRVNAIEHDRVIVTPAPGAPARMPFWHGEYAARSSHLASRVGALRRELNAVRTDEQAATLAARYHSDLPTVTSLVEYVHQQNVATGGVPDEQTLIVEQFRDEMGSVRVVVHAPFGGRVNAPWGMALASRVRDWLADQGPSCETGELRAQVTTTDGRHHAPAAESPRLASVAVLRDLTAGDADVACSPGGRSSLFGARFRPNAARCLLPAWQSRAGACRCGSSASGGGCCCRRWRIPVVQFC